MMFSVTSCGEEFLNLQPQQNVSDDVFLQNMDDFRTAILGSYDQMQSATWYGRYFLLVPDVMGMDVKQNASANRAKEWAEYNGSETDFIPNDIWRELYQGISIANRIINADFTPTAEAQVEFDNIIGQALAMRAIGHFDLVRIFGQHYTFTADASHLGVPIVLDFDIESRPERNTVAQVYDQVISDLTAAIGLMTIDGPNAGYLSKEGAQAYLSRVYLYKEDWDMAESLATAVINSGKYSLVSNADYPTQFLDGNSSEAIFEMIYSQVDGLGSNHLGGMYKVIGYGDYLPSDDFFALMDPSDIRGDTTTMFSNDESNLGGIYGTFRVNKYPSTGSDNGTDNLPIIRLSEVYLNRAEARAQQGGKDVGAAADANMLRSLRAPAATPVGGTGQALIDDILIERRIELAFEGHQIFDLTRYKRGVVRVNCTAPPGACNIPYPNERFILPMPEDETNTNENIVQNPGY
jgi:starch-binding outer membrane protein, SusD/RagB family